MTVTIGLAFLAGLASFLSPCVFSLVPAYIGYLGGRSAAVSQSEDPANRWNIFSHGLAFVVGFSLVFITLGVAASALGGLLSDIRPWIGRIGGVIVIIFGIHMTGIFRIPFLEYDLRPQNRTDRQRSYFSSAFMGVAFSAGWSPCIGPVLGAIATMAMNGGSIAQGVKLFSAYSAGLAVPFLIAALGIGWVTNILRNHRKVMHYVEIGMGGVMILVGVLLVLGKFATLNQFGFFIDFGL
jgi:cytochrome c-type biogenesis protein